MKKYILLGLLVSSSWVYSQVGINNTDPKATLDVTAKTTNGSRAEGIIAPRLTGDQIKLADAQYTAAQNGTLIYATDAVTTGATVKTMNITVSGYYYFDGAVWQPLRSVSTSVQQPLNVTAELDANYTASVTDDIILFNPSVDRVLTLPTSGVDIGKKYYVSTKNQGISYAPASAIRNGSYPGLFGGTSATLMYIGGGVWDVFTGY